MANGSDETANTGWMSDVQRLLALLLIGTVSFMVITLTIKVAVRGDLVTAAALLKELKDALTNMSLIALGFFFGNTMSKMASDAGQQKVVDKLTSSAPPATGPVAPVAAPVVVVSWWSLLTDAEKAAMTEAAKTDAKMQALVAAFASGKAEPPDIVTLVDAGILTPDRAAVFKTA